MQTLAGVASTEIENGVATLRVPVGAPLDPLAVLDAIAARKGVHVYDVEVRRGGPAALLDLLQSLHRRQPELAPALAGMRWPGDDRPRIVLDALFGLRDALRGGGDGPARVAGDPRLPKLFASVERHAPLAMASALPRPRSGDLIAALRAARAAFEQPRHLIGGAMAGAALAFRVEGRLFASYASELDAVARTATRAAAGLARDPRRAADRQRFTTLAEAATGIAAMARALARYARVAVSGG